MSIKKFSSKRVIGFALAAMLALMVLTPTSVLAATAAGTIITNTATVTWASNPTGVSDSVDVTVALLPAAPTVAYVSTNPTAASNPAEGVSSGSSVDVVYTVTSGANGGDDYNLTWASTDSASLTADTPDAGNATTILDLGGSAILSSAGNVITVPGVLADHGLASGETVVIGGAPYTITGSAANGANTNLTLSGSPGAADGTPVYERVTITLTTVVGTTATSGTHDMALTVTSQTDGTATATVNDPTLYVVAVTLTIDKTANVAQAQPGDTISYSIDVTNSTTASAATVVITDPIPAFTDFNGGVVAGSCAVTYASDTPPATWTYVPGASPDAAVTGIRFSCGDLAAGATVTVGFDVVVEN